MLNKESYLTTSELAKKLGITYQGAIKKLRNNREQLASYLIVDEKQNIKGIALEGYEQLINLPHRVSYASKVAVEMNKKESINNEILETKEQVIKAKDEHIQTLKDQLEREQAENNSLKAELEYYRGAGIFTRLIGYKKK